MKHHILSLTLLQLIVLSCYGQTGSWFTPLNFGLLTPPGEVRFDDIYFISRDTGIVVSSFGMIFKTYDGAAHWSLKKVATPSTYFRSVEFSSDGQVGIAGSLDANGVVFRSADRGETWEDITLAIQDTGASPRRICGLAHYSNTFFGVGWWGANQARFYKSTDAGFTWTTSYIDTTVASGLVDVIFLSSRKGFASGYHRLPSGRHESVVIRTLDGGDTWTKVFGDSTIGGRVWKLQFLDNLTGVGSIEPLYRDTVAMIKTTDGGDTWLLTSVGHINGWATGWGTQGIGFVNKDHGWIGGYYNGMFETLNGGLTWDTLQVNEKCNRFFLIDNTMYLSAGTVYKYNGEHHSGISTTTPVSYQHKLYPVTPNPAKGIISIEFDVNAPANNIVLEVVNIDGRKTYPVMSGYLGRGHYKYTWDSSSAPAGNYIVWLGTDDAPMVEQFILKQ